MATFLPNSGYLTEVLIVEESGSTDEVDELLYQVPTGFYVELHDFSVEFDSSISTSEINIYKRLTSISDTIKFWTFNLSPAGPSAPAELSDIYHGVFESSASSLINNVIFSRKTKDCITLYPGDEIRLTLANLLSGEDWRSRLTLFVYKNP